MKLTVTSEFHCVADKGETWSVDRGTHAYYSRFLDVFEEVRVFCRVEPGKRSEVMQKVTGDGVKVIAVRDFNDPRSFLRVARDARATARFAAELEGAFLLHAPGTMASLLGSQLRRRRRSFAIEVAGDPRESLAGATLSSKAIALLAGRQMRRHCEDATASRYVTERALQRCYPPAVGTQTFTASDVDIPDVVFATPVPSTRNGPVLDLGFVGNLQKPYKGLDVLLEALRITQHPHRLAVLGDGSLRQELEVWSNAHDLADRVTFLGAVPMGEEVRSFLKSRDMVVQPSRTEGVSRALIEAMAIGLPCLATPVGGTPDLLDAGALVPVDNSEALAKAIDQLAENQTGRAAQALRNRAVAKRFTRSLMDEVHNSFHRAIRDTTERDQRSRTGIQSV